MSEHRLEVKFVEEIRRWESMVRGALVLRRLVYFVGRCRFLGQKFGYPAIIGQELCEKI